MKGESAQSANAGTPTRGCKSETTRHIDGYARRHWGDRQDEQRDSPPDNGFDGAVHQSNDPLQYRLEPRNRVPWLAGERSRASRDRDGPAGNETENGCGFRG